MKQAKDLTIVIVNFNTPEWIEKCLHSLETCVISKSVFEIGVVLVDNGSDTDKKALVKEIASQYNFVETLFLPTNVGFAAGNNAALKNSSSRYMMLLNSDTQATENTHLDLLLQYMDEHAEIGAITPKVELESGELDWASHRGEPTPWACATYFSGLEKIFPNISFFSSYHLKNRNLHAVHEIDACSGAAMIVRQSAILKVGLLDEQFFMYAEDLDWCKRLRDAGYKIIYFPKSVVIHHKYKSGLKNEDQDTSKKTRHYFYETMLQYFDKHYRQKYSPLARLVLRLFITIKKGAL